MERIQLKNVTTIVNGSTPSTANSENWDGDIAWITPKDLSNFQQRFISNGSRNITETGYNSCSTTMVPKGTVLLTSRAPIGYLAIASDPLCTNQGFKSLICDANRLLPLYLYYWLSTKVEYLKSISDGTTFKELSKTTLENVEIDLPDIETQQHIVGTIGTIDDLIENKIAILQGLDDVLSAKFEAIVSTRGYSNKPLIRLVEREIKGNWGDEKPCERSREAIVLRGTDIAGLAKYEATTPPIRYIQSKNIENDCLKNNDVIIEMSGGGPKQPTGRSWVFDESLFQKPVLCSNFCRGIRCHNIAETAVFFLSLKDLYKRRITYTYELGTTGIKNLNITKLLAEQFLPNISANQMSTLGNDFLAIQNYKSKTINEIRLLKQQKAVLLSKYF